MAYFQDDGTVAAKAITVCSQQAGKQYVWGAGGPDTFDCSGLVHYAYAIAGLPGTGNATAHSWTTYTIVAMGEKVEIGQERPGDLVLPHPGHVGMAVGNNQMWEAPDVGIPVRIGHYSTPYAIRRLATPSNGAPTSVNTVSNVFNPLAPLDPVFDWMTNTHNWLRVGQVLAGTALLYVVGKEILR